MEATSGTRVWLATMAVVFALCLPGQTLAQVTEYQQRCIDAWSDAPASEVCSYGSLTRISESADSNAGNCDIQSVSCRVVANNSSGLSTAWGLRGKSSNRSPADTETLDVCFASSDTAASGYTVHFRAGCNSGETSQADME